MCITLSDYCNIALREITCGFSSWHQNECSATSSSADSVTKRRPNGSFKWWGVYQGINSPTNGALCKWSPFIWHLMLFYCPLCTYSTGTVFPTEIVWKQKQKALNSKRSESGGGGRCLSRTKRAVNWEHTGTDLKAASVSVCCWGEEECATLSAVCLELRLCALLYNLTFADTSWLTYSPEQTRPNCSGPFGSLLVLSNGLGKYKFLVLAEKAALLRWPLLFTYIFTFFFITVPSAKVNAVTQIAAIPVLY